ncbi:hypothetical protein NUV89_14155 [Pseudomonas sp. 18.1.10]|uniref:hypothetical protein n=1 Tax=Pseudomonas sp. 18.1.10 TaxID=2969302 RepID=UPI00214FE259|nr:hypothetical protein [Pseudomonas sp. 18.1.10]MCR4539545.1 hypothetical protein [Pseudomonas sp. 18.1.10]
MSDQCKSSLEPGQSLCGVTHCETYRQSSAMARWCKCKNWEGKPIPDCTPQGGSFPVETYNCFNRATAQRLNISQDECQLLRDGNKDWSWQACYCCCSCFAWGTRVTVAQGEYRTVQFIGVGDPVLTSTVKVVGGKPKLTWESRPVTFSDGMVAAPHQPAVLLQYGDKGELAVTLDQPMLLADGSLKAADRLTLDDWLVDHKGKPVKLHALVLGKFTLGFHSLSTQDFSQSGFVERYLEVNGVVAGDHLVMAMQDDAAMASRFAKGHDALPRIGSSAYTKTRKGSSAHSQLGAKAREISNEAFLPLEELLGATSPVPYGAAPYMTQKQAADVAINGAFRSMGQTFLMAEFRYLEKLFKAFYPKVNFHLNWEDPHPNQFAFTSYGQDTVYVSGQLLRLEGMFKQGLAMIMAQGVGRFVQTDYTTDSGLTCTGLADYFGANEVLQAVFYGSWGAWVNPGQEQIKALFSLIAPANRVGHEKCATPSIPCRLESIEAAVIGMPLPPCAGGPVAHSLTLDSATWTHFEGALAVLASFNQRLNDLSAKIPSNYLLDSAGQPVPVALVQMDKNLPWQAWLVIDERFKPESVTTLTVRDVRSDNGSTLDPAASSVTVEGTP